ncbi:hypothetical protein NDU88_005886 [Pleurodeles waltl]|uniref:Uncharacterized protein n=1 Tax=Pleurodeles waltl TaxID=8319 RepID=A0AAV7WAU6_PLEWA|nr:hypothetical protein NDU88_005886 [Pleurodeles waltl]
MGARTGHLPLYALAMPLSHHPAICVTQELKAQGLLGAAGLQSMGNVLPENRFWDFSAPPQESRDSPLMHFT